MEVSSINPNLISTKFLFAVLVVTLGFILVMHQLTAETWMQFTAVIGGIYVAGNVADKLAASQTQPVKQNQTNP